MQSFKHEANHNMFSTEFLHEAQKTDKNSLLRHLATICIFSLKIEKKGGGTLTWGSSFYIVKISHPHYAE